MEPASKKNVSSSSAGRNLVDEILRTILKIAVEFWTVLGAMAPYLLFGFLVAGLLSVFISPETVERHLGGGGAWPVLKAAIFGVPLPLCSCGVIPVAAGLRRHGAGKGATTAFLLSTPQTGVDSIFVTFSLLGPVFAVFRPLVALVSGVLGGTVVSLTAKDGSGTAGSAIRCTDECCEVGAGKGGRLGRALRYGFLTLPRDIGKALLVGLVIAALLSAIVPKNYFAEHLGTGVIPILVMMLLGIPVYVCATASVPVALALIMAGVSPGAALAFLMTGPATNAAAIATIWKIMGKRTTLIYLATVAVTALCAGLLLDYIFTATDIALDVAHKHVASGWYAYFQPAAAVALLGVLGVAVFRPSLGRLKGLPAEAAAESVTLSIGGMTCSHCVDTVTRALREQSGVSSAQVELRSGQAVVTGTDLDVGVMCAAVEQLGYKAAPEKGDQ